MAKGKYERWLQPESLLKITNWAANGCTNDEIARNMGVHRATLQRWMAEHSDIRDAVKEGQMMAVEAVENALFMAATGRHTVTETVEEFKGSMQDGKPTDGELTRRSVTKSVPPSVSAQIFYLKNRVPGRYSDRRTVEVEQAVPTVVLGVNPGRANG